MGELIETLVRNQEFNELTKRTVTKKMEQLQYYHLKNL